MARSARSEGNVRPGPRDSIRRHIVADTFRLGSFLQAARSATADKSVTNFRAVESARLAAGFRAAASSGEYFLRRARNAGATAAAAAANPSVVEASEEKTVVVESPLYRVELSNRGGVVKTWQLNKYFDDQKPPHPLDLVNDSVAQQLGWPFSLVLADPQLAGEREFGALPD